MRTLFFVLSFHLGAPEPRGDSWFAADKAKHFFTAAVAHSMAFGALRTTGLNRRDALIGATIVSGGVSIGKELYDRRTGGDPSFKDLTWDAAGIAAMSILLRHSSP